MTNVDDVRARFAATAARVAEHSLEQVERVREELRTLFDPTGSERAIDVGTGAGTLARALAPLVKEVVGVDVVPELLEAARRDAPRNVTFVESDATRLPFDRASFDIAATRRTLHHVARPELVVAELARVVRPLGTVLVEDQIAPVDPLDALALDRFERSRDPSHTRLLPDIDLRHLFEANDLELVRSRFRRERRALEPYLDLAGCVGPERQRAASLSPGGPEEYVAESAWYVLRRRR
ncbi:MAG TPA: class I SAM-dependent methyltransferase [Gaiellaceae bacterium]|jgi:ubiquinone/menaquinone biosynthesis C-methylase UbiE|nr:class I SAM-dependent methyltransferase [Gaiellaceae bacterium]